jgi:hypothetical protein
LLPQVLLAEKKLLLVAVGWQLQQRSMLLPPLLLQGVRLGPVQFPSSLSDQQLHGQGCCWGVEVVAAGAVKAQRGQRQLVTPRQLQIPPAEHLLAH